VCRLRSLSDSDSSLSAGAAVTGSSASERVYRLAEHRYGREELLALYKTSSSVSPDLHDSSVMTTKPLPPLALVPISDEEQVNNTSS